MWLAHKIVQGIAQLVSRNKLPILIYHQVLEKPDPFRTCTPTVEQFRAQMNVLQRYFNPLSVEVALRLLAENKLPANSICVTFDDGYLDNLTLASPVLKELGIPATVYVASAFSSGENMWNDKIIDFMVDEDISEYDLSTIDAGTHIIISNKQRRQLVQAVLGQLKYLPTRERLDKVDGLLKAHNYKSCAPKMMNCEQLKLLKGFNITVAAHTHDHPIMAVLPIEEQRSQLVTNLEQLEQCGGNMPMGFAYPNGKIDTDYTQETADLVKELGFSYAVTTHNGVCTAKSDFFQLPRVSSWEKRPLRFHLRLLLDMIHA